MNRHPDMEDAIEYLRLDGVADRIGLTAATVRVMSSRGKLPPPDQIVGADGTRKWKLWRPETIDEWDRTRKDPS